MSNRLKGLLMIAGALLAVPLISNMIAGNRTPPAPPAVSAPVASSTTTDPVGQRNAKGRAIAACTAKLGPLDIEATGGNLEAGELNVVARRQDGKLWACWATRKGDTWTAEATPVSPKLAR